MKRLVFRRSSGFLLLEAMLAVAIFALGILALGRCVENCLKVEKFRREESLARRALANYFIQIESGAIPLADKTSEKLKGAWEGMTINMVREPLTLINEKEQELFGLYQVTLQLVWGGTDDVVSRELKFIIYPRQRG
jgi:hypothetical protein